MESGSGIGAEGRKAAGGGFVEPSVPTASSETVEEAKRRIEAEDGPGNDKVGKGGVLKDHEFDLDHTDSRGRQWAGHFKCHAMTIKEKVDVGLIRSRMSGGVMAHMLDVTTGNFLEMIAYLVVAIDDGPEWAKDLEALHDPGVLIAVYKEAFSHEERFLGAEQEDASPPPHAGPGGDDGAGVPPADE